MLDQSFPRVHHGGEPDHETPLADGLGVVLSPYHGLDIPGPFDNGPCREFLNGLSVDARVQIGLVHFLDQAVGDAFQDITFLDEIAEPPDVPLGEPHLTDDLVLYAVAPLDTVRVVRPRE